MLGFGGYYSVGFSGTMRREISSPLSSLEHQGDTVAQRCASSQTFWGLWSSIKHPLMGPGAHQELQH